MGVVLKEGRHVAWVIIDRQEKANSFDEEHLEEFAEKLFSACKSGKEAVAMRGAGEKYFSTGIDLETVAKIASLQDSYRIFVEKMGKVFEGILLCDNPVIAAVNGYALGLGFELVQVSDLSVALESAKLGSPAMRWGMIPPVTPLLSYNKVAAEMVFASRLLTAGEAQSLGLVNYTVKSASELEDKVESLASKIAESERWARSLAKKTIGIKRLEEIYEGLRLIADAAARREVSSRIEEFFLKKKRGTS